MLWVLIALALLILLFIFAITRKSYRKLPHETLPKQMNPFLPWGLQQHGVDEEALHPFANQDVPQALFNEMLERMKHEPIVTEITKAVLFGLDIALQSDDYANTGIEFEDPEFVQKQLQKVAYELFDNDVYAQYNFYSRSILVLQDMLAQKKSPEEKATLKKALQSYQAQLKVLEPALKQKFTGLNISEIGQRKDRELFYFKMAITNYLRGKNIIPELDRLYSVYGVNYQIEPAFQTVTHEFPVFNKLLQTDFRELASRSLFELQTTIQHELKQSSPDYFLND